jgi:hypothetical protein
MSEEKVSENLRKEGRKGGREGGRVCEKEMLCALEFCLL